jgi:hypothetical protein
MTFKNNISPLKLTQYSYFECPNCEEDIFLGTDLKERAKKEPNGFMAFCDHCQKRWMLSHIDGTIVGKDEIPVEFPLGHERTLVLLVQSDPSDTPIYIVVLGYLYYDKEGKVAVTNGKYYYNEHTCPTNYLKTEAVIHKGDTDPHGVFRFVRSIPVREAMKTLDVTADMLFDSNNHYDLMPRLFPEVTKTNREI